MHQHWGCHGGTLEENQQNVKNELFVNTINNFVFVSEPFIIRRPPSVKDAPGFLVRRRNQSHPSQGASSGLSKAPEDRHTYLFLFEDELRVIWRGAGRATGKNGLLWARRKQPFGGAWRAVGCVSLSRVMILGSWDPAPRRAPWLSLCLPSLILSLK